MVILVSKTEAGDIPLFMVSGDTLFPGSCGRVDLPESNHVDMWDSLKKLKVSYNDDLLVFPGHGYSKPNTTIGEEKRIGYWVSLSPSGCLAEKRRWLTKSTFTGKVKNTFRGYILRVCIIV